MRSWPSVVIEVPEHILQRDRGLLGDAEQLVADDLEHERLDPEVMLGIERRTAGESAPPVRKFGRRGAASSSGQVTTTLRYSSHSAACPD